MNTLNAIVLTISSPRAAAVLLEAAGKSFLILMAAFILAPLCRRSTAATLHFIWLAALTSLLFLPVAGALAPRWSGPAWASAFLSPRWSHFSGNEVPVISIEGQARAMAHQSPATVAGSVSPNHSKPAARHFSLDMLIWPAWVAGVLSTLLVFLRQSRMLRKLEREARPVTDPEFLQLWNLVRREFGLSRNVRLLQTDEPWMPMTWGWWRPAALLPSEAMNWEGQRVRLVLRHELAHVRRNDCLAQALAALVCALYWFNPLAWLAAARMRTERERACDDLVVSLGETKPSEYAGHLLEVARQWSGAPRAALPVAKRFGLEQRLRALLDGANNHGEMSRRAAAAVTCALAFGLFALAGWRAAAEDAAPDALRQQLIARLQDFSRLKEKQAEQLAAAAGLEIAPRFKDFFDAAIRGDWRYVTNKYDYYKQNHRQYSHTNAPDFKLDTTYWNPVLEICLAYYDVADDEPRYVQEFEQDIIQSIPEGSLYFGGTDPGRGLVTAFCRSHPEADPFFTLTQNALADNTYREYLRQMYGRKISLPTEEDAKTIFENYIADARQRLAANKLKPREEVVIKEDGRIVVSGQVAIMQINAEFVRTIFARNPNREFYLEESFPLDWMYPNLQPHGLILKINRTALPSLSAETIQRDEDYWQPRFQEMIGGWLRPETPLAAVLDFVDKTYGRGDLSGFTGNSRFARDTDSQRMFSKLRSSIAGVYAWRVGGLEAVATPAEYLAPAGVESRRLSAAADFAFRQALALCPCSWEASLRYASFLVSQGRKADAIAVLENGLRHPGSTGDIHSEEMAKALAKLRTP
jgi:beta-lactamase regulating signal transducer with metallopeptidase domain